MMKDYLGLLWQEVKSDLDEQGISYITKVTQPPTQRVELFGDLRIIRVRAVNNSLEIILSQEKYSKISRDPH